MVNISEGTGNTAGNRNTHPVKVKRTENHKETPAQPITQNTSIMYEDITENISTKKHNRIPRQKSVKNFKPISRPKTTMSTIVEESCENISQIDSTRDRVSQNNIKRKNVVNDKQMCTKQICPLPDIEI